MRLDTLIKVVVGIEHLELGAAVYLVGCRLVLVAEPVDELLVEYVTLLELGVLLKDRKRRLQRTLQRDRERRQENLYQR